MQDMKRMQLGQVVDFTIDYNRRQKRAEQKAEKTAKHKVKHYRMASPDEVDAMLRG